MLLHGSRLSVACAREKDRQLAVERTALRDSPLQCLRVIGPMVLDQGTFDTVLGTVYLARADGCMV